MQSFCMILQCSVARKGALNSSTDIVPTPTLGNPIGFLSYGLAGSRLSYLVLGVSALPIW